MNTILLIEDDTDLLTSVERILKLANYEVIKTESGTEALEILNQPTCRVSLILCDIIMPEIDGYGLLLAVKNISRYKNIPFVFMSGKGEKSEIRKGMDLGADDYLIKPFTPNELLSMVSSRIEKTKQARESWENLLDFENLITDLKLLSASDLSKKFTVKKLQKKDILFNEGDKVKNIFFIIKGQFRISTTNDSGKEFVLNIFREGDFLAYNSLFRDPDNHDGTAVALEQSEVIVFPKEEFLNLLATSKTLCCYLMKFTTELLGETERRLTKMVYDSARKKVADAILFISKKYDQGRNTCNSFPISRDELSSISGVTPETASRNLTDFRVQKLIEFSKGELVVLDRKRLGELKN